jgi:hypothetical protein
LPLKQLCLGLLFGFGYYRWGVSLNNWYCKA